MVLKHFLVTRFNLKVAGWDATKNGEAVLNDVWLDDRFRLFESYCLPSVKNQSDQDFVWCLFFDTSTTEKYRSRIHQLAKSYANLQPLYINGMDELAQAFVNFINRSCPADVDYVITSRLDNDDLLHQSFIEQIKTDVASANQTLVDKTVYDMRCGLQISVERETSEIRRLTKFFNPFVSLIETTDKVESVLSRKHGQWSSAPQIIACTKRSMWVELVHQKNKMNSVNRRARKLFRFPDQEFGLPPGSMQPQGRLRVFADNLTLPLVNLYSSVENKWK